MFFDQSRPDRLKRAQKKTGGHNKARQFLAAPIPPARSYQLFGYDEILHGSRTLVFDVETFKNYWLVSFMCEQSRKIIYFENTPNGYTINGDPVDYLVWSQYLTYILFRYKLIGFNSRSYDMPITLVAIKGVPTQKLKEISDEIIKEEMQPYEVERKYQVKAPLANHIDIINVAPITASLKIYGGRIHCERMQDLPFPVDSELTQEQAAIVRDYNINDLDITLALYQKLLPFIEMRELLGSEYNQDLRSKSDAQIAEAIIVTELENLGPLGKKAETNPGDEFYYQPPEWISFKTPQLQYLLDVVRSTPFVIGAGGSAACPQAIEALRPVIGSTTYRLGVGGLHSSEESVAYVATADRLIIDRDVASYYPYIILNNKFYPEHLGIAFLEVYRAIVMRRLKLKKEKNPLEAGLKIAINGIFGKFGNYYSAVYSPHLLTQVTMTGQLALLMQIEMAEMAGIPVISANTDGVVYYCPVDKYETLENTLIEWEAITSFITEETRYKGLYSRDVNNYIAVKLDGSVKSKGVYCERGSAQNSILSKNPEALICSDAIQEFLANGTPIFDTISQCGDIKRFVSVRNVKGGGEKDGVYLGKAVRWYYAKDETGTINYVLSGNKVPKSEGAKPLMILPNNLPDDLDLDYYFNVCSEILFDIGYNKRPEARKLI